MRNLHVDCGTCSVRGKACGDCVVTVLLGAPAELELNDDEQHALDALSGGGLVPPLRLVPGGGEEPEVPWRQHG
ncbi:hypothetical protein ACQBAR_06065 [Propionibacteriaceae bacterium Y1685]|uniref:hypothetical protein n=1 Tax=Microlunatus sp. Y1700 TaxID=3418487 RepID=UPI003B82013F